MSIQKNIGKNTIGDNNKMAVSLHDYNMSTHDLSTIVRTSMSPATLVPTCCILVQKGDVLDFDIESQVLTHPTIGPLFGSFKFENHLFFGAMRLYNSYLHNNRTKIGLDMSTIKFPKIKVTLDYAYDNPTDDNQWTQIHPSALMSYLGQKGYGYMSVTGKKNIVKNATKLCVYYDIFKNYYANTQEDNFYTIGVTSEVNITINGNTIPDETNIPNSIGNIQRTSVIKFLDTKITKKDVLLSVVQGSGSQQITMTPDELGTWSADAQPTLTTTAVPTSTTWYVKKVYLVNRTILAKWKLESLDELRDLILQTPGNQDCIVTDNPKSIPLLKDMVARTNNRLNTSYPQYGLCLKTYNSDLYQNWINNDWIEGTNGINEISGVDVSDGVLTMDALNLSQKIYNMLNRVVVSGGTYRDWLETVYTGSNYFERCETPVFEGGTSQEIVFQEVISNSTSTDEPLGTLAGRGVNMGKQKGGHIKIKITEPGYIMCISSITPRIDYSQGNDWDVDFDNMDDLHKPALDGIGYQDSVNGERAWWSDYYNASGTEPQKTAAGKTVAWINYMTNVNRVYGNFASGMPEEFMVLNRNYSLAVTGANPRIEDLTTYIDPVKYNYIFADTDLDAMNFWVQIKFNIELRRLISAKQIPNL